MLRKGLSDRSSNCFRMQTEANDNSGDSDQDKIIAEARTERTSFLFLLSFRIDALKIQSDTIKRSAENLGYSKLNTN